MKGFHGNIEKLTLGNTNFRQVLYTAEHCQLVLMTLPVGGEIGSEIHAENDQFSVLKLVMVRLSLMVMNMKLQMETL